MLEAEFKVELPHGLHMRPAAQLVQLAKTFPGTVQLVQGGEAVDAKSLLALQTLEVAQGTPVRLRVEGEGEAAAALLESVRQLLTLPAPTSENRGA